MSHESHITAETIPQQVPFENADDYRRHPRIPIQGPVRLGPPHQAVRSTLILEDLSSGGMFIRCARPVQVGARFSVELPLPGGERLYVPEVEVVYNRQIDNEVAGFGAQFVNLPAEIEAKLIDAAQFDSIVAGSGRDVSPSMIVYQEAEISASGDDKVMMLPAMPRVSDLRLSSFRPFAVNRPEPLAMPRAEDVSTLRIRKKLDDELPTVEGSMDEAGFETADTVRPDPIEETIDQDVRVETTYDDEMDLAMSDSEIAFGRGRRTRGVARSSKSWLFVAAGAACIVLFAGAFFRTSAPEGQAYAESKEPETNGLSSETHSALLGDSDAVRDVAPIKDKGKAANETEVSNPLPPLVDVEALAAKRRASKSAASPAPSKSTPAPVAPASAAPALAEAPQTKPSPAKIAETPKPAPAKKAPAISGSAPRHDVAMNVSPGAKVLRTFVLKSPARFVVDLTAQDEFPAITKGNGRVGRHDDFMRIVIDSDVALTTGRVEKRGDKLYVSLIP